MSTAQEIVNRIRKVTKPARIEAEEWADYNFPETRERVIAVIRSIDAWVVAEGVVAISADGPDAKLFGYIAAEILDSAASEFDLPDSARIEGYHGRGDIYTLRWE